MNDKEQEIKLKLNNSGSVRRSWSVFEVCRICDRDAFHLGLRSHRKTSPVFTGRRYTSGTPANRALVFGAPATNATYLRYNVATYIRRSLWIIGHFGWDLVTPLGVLMGESTAVSRKYAATPPNTPLENLRQIRVFARGFRVVRGVSYLDAKFMPP